MYFTLTVNEQLANAMRAAAEVIAEIGIFKKQEEASDVKRVDILSIVELDDILCDVVCRIAGLSSSVISACVVDESEKEIMNRLNPESHVSK